MAFHRGISVLTTFTREKACFVKCDTRSWDDQLRLFEAAVSKSPSKSVDIVVGNAGVGRGSGDPMMALEGERSKSSQERMVNQAVYSWSNIAHCQKS